MSEKLFKCEECGADVGVPRDAEVGELIECASCAMEYEIQSLEPLATSLFEEDEK